MLKSIRHDRKKIDRKLEPVKPVPIRADKPSGIVYVAYGDKAKSYCEISIRSAKKFHPGVKVAVISAQPIPGADIHIKQPELDLIAREYKTQIYNYSPFEYTLYLDADTQVVGSLEAGFNALAKGWDMAMSLDYRQTIGRIDHIPVNDVRATVELIGTGEYPHLNTGMMFFRKSPEVEELFSLWHKEWLRFKYRDQAAFMRAFHQSRVKTYVFAWQWNTHREERAKHVWHLHHMVDRSWTGTLP